MVPEIFSTKDRSFCHFGLFLPFYPPDNAENQNFEKMKKHLEIPSFYPSEPKIMIICHIVPEIWRMTDVIVIFHFGLFFALLPPNTQKIKIKKKRKKCLEIPSFYTCVPKIMIR